MAIVYSKRPTEHVKHGGILNQVSVKTILGMDILFSNKSYDICILHFFIICHIHRRSGDIFSGKLLFGFESITYNQWLFNELIDMFETKYAVNTL